jgi:hypothetical protein
MLIIDEKAEEGTWFKFKGDAEFLIKRVGSMRRRALWRQFMGKNLGSNEKRDFEKSADLRITLGGEALVDSRKVEIPSRYLEGTVLAEEKGNVILDGRWTPDVKKAVLSDVAGLLSFIVEKCDSLDAQADEEESGKE